MGIFKVPANSLIYESSVVLFVLFSTFSIFNCTILAVLFVLSILFLPNLNIILKHSKNKKSTSEIKFQDAFKLNQMLFIQYISKTQPL
jgi:hypothetical protein